MAVVRKSGKGWQVLIRKKNYAPVYKTFISKAVATNCVQETELKIEQGIFQNLEEAGRTTLKEILLSYRDNVTTSKVLEGLFFKYCCIRIKLNLRIFNLKHISQLVF